MLTLKGTDVLLHTDSGAEIVENVLVGEPAAELLPFSAGGIPAYTLGIPKGDVHDWNDAFVEFFGLRFRTVGVPEQGIEANIPTQWHKKVHVQQLVTNGSCTIYESGTFRKHVFRDVFLCDVRGETASKFGAERADALQMYLYSCLLEDEYIPKIGDIVIPHESPMEFDTASEQAVSESMAQLRRAYPDYGTVRTVGRKLCGMKFDIEITA